jgi:protein-arginine kinase activator protein McsA
MMNTRAKASIAIEREDFAEAARLIEKGRKKIQDFYDGAENPEMLEHSPELAFLQEWLEEVRAKQPVTKMERMKREMDLAIQNEAYERAAEIRDAMRAMTRKK